MPLSVDQLRQFDSNWGNLVVQQDASGTQVKGGGLRHALASLFRTDAAQARNKATYTAIRNAIMQDDRFFAPDVKAKADELLKGLDNGSGISASTIKGIIRQLDEMSTPEKQRDAVKKAAVGHLAATGVPGNIPASIQAKYTELAADFAAFRPNARTSMASIKVDQRVTEFNRLMHGFFRSMGDDAKAQEVFCATLNKYTPGDGGVVTLNPADRLKGLLDTVQDNLRELDTIGNARGAALRDSFLATLKLTGGVRSGALTELADKGAALPKCGLDFLNGRSGAFAIHRAIAEMADAMERGRSELSRNVTTGFGLDEAGACMVKAAVSGLSQAEKRNLLDALGSAGGLNLLGCYAQNVADPKTQRMNLVYSSLLTHLRAELEGKDPAATVRPPQLDPRLLPPAVLSEYSPGDTVMGDLAQQINDFGMKGSDIEHAANPAAELKKRMDSVAKGKVFMQFVTGMADLFVPNATGKPVFDLNKVDTAFNRDVDRDHNTAGYMQIRLADGTTIAPNSGLEGRDALAKLVTGDSSARYDGLRDDKTKTKVQLLMCCLHQGMGDTVTRGVGLAYRLDQQFPRVLLTQGGGARAHNYVISKAPNGDIKIGYNLRFTSPSLQLVDDANMMVKSTTQDSTAEFSLEITIPPDNLEKLSGAGWSTFKGGDALSAKENGADPQRFETLQNDVADEFRFTGDVSLSFSVRADELKA